MPVHCQFTHTRSPNPFLSTSFTGALADDGRLWVRYQPFANDMRLFLLQVCTDLDSFLQSAQVQLRHCTFCQKPLTEIQLMERQLGSRCAKRVKVLHEELHSRSHWYT